MRKYFYHTESGSIITVDKINWELAETNDIFIGHASDKQEAKELLRNYLNKTDSYCDETDLEEFVKDIYIRGE